MGPRIKLHGKRNRQDQPIYESLNLFPSKEKNKYIHRGDLVRHIEDEGYDNFGLGIVVDVIDSGPVGKNIAQIAWQNGPFHHIHRANYFTFDGLVVVNKANENDTVYSDRNC